MTDPRRCKALVIEAMRRLVDDALAEWGRTEGGEPELRLATGEVFVVGDSGITAQWQLRPPDVLRESIGRREGRESECS